MSSKTRGRVKPGRAGPSKPAASPTKQVPVVAPPKPPQVGWSHEDGEKAAVYLGTWKKERQKLCSFAETAGAIGERMWERLEQAGAANEANEWAENDSSQGILAVFGPALVGRLAEQQLMQIEVLVQGMQRSLGALDSLMLAEQQEWPQLLARCDPNDSCFYVQALTQELRLKKDTVEAIKSCLLHPPSGASSTKPTSLPSLVQALKRDEILLSTLTAFASAAIDTLREEDPG